MRRAISVMMLLMGLVWLPRAQADQYVDTINQYIGIEKVKPFYQTAYAYAVFPTIGKGGAVIGAAYGSGRIYQKGKLLGDVTMSQLSIGFQMGGQVFSEMIFFEDQQALEQFTQGDGFQFGAQMSAVALTLGASASAGSTGVSVGAGDKQIALNYINGMAVFTLAKGGLMYEATIGGQKFEFTPKF